MFFLYFDLYGHGKLDLKFVHGRAEKSVGSNKICPKECTDQRPKSLTKNNRTTSFWRKRFVYLQTHLLV